MRKRIWSLILAVVLIATAVLTGVGCDATDPWTEDAYFTNLYVYNGTAWTQVTGSGGGGGGATVLGDLTDVFDTAAVEGDMLYYDQVSGTWLVGTRAGLAGLFAGVTILGDLADVSVIGPADDTFLYYDLGTGLWKSRILADADIPAAIARDAEVTADIAVHSALNTGVHGVTGTVLGTEDVDNTPVNGATTDPISSDWAYDYETNIEISSGIITMPNQPAAGAYLTATQTIPTGTNTLVQLGSESYDVGGCFDTGTYNYTCPADGLYIIAGQVTYFNPDAGSRLNAYIFQNSSAIANGSQSPGGVVTTGPSTVAVAFAVAGDTFSLLTYHNCAGAEDIRSGSAWTYMYVAKIA